MNLRKPLILLAIALFSLVGFALSPATSPSPYLVYQADQHLTRKEYNSAVDLYKEALALKPDQPEVRQKLVEVYVLKRKYDSARTALEDWTNLDPRDPRPHVSLGTLLESQGQLEEASAEFDQALSLDQQQKEARHHLADLYLKRGQLERARNEFETLLLQNAADQRAHFRLGEILATEDPSMALPHLRQAADLNQDSQIAAEAGQLSDTILEGQKEESRAYAAASLGLTLLKLKEINLAQQQFLAATKLDPRYVDAQAYLGYTWLLQRRPDLAEEALQKAVELNPSSLFAHHILGETLRAEGRAEEALAEMQKAESLGPADPYLLSDIALTYLAANDLNNAEEYYVRAATQTPADPMFIEQLAHFYLDHMFKLDAGLTAASHLVEIQPEKTENLDLRGWALYLNERREEAEQTFVEALKLDPYLASAHYHLALLYEKSGRLDQAKQEYGRAAELDLTGYFEKRSLAALDDLSAEG